MSKEFKFLQGYKEVGVIYYLPPTYTPSTYATDMTISTSGGYGTTTTHTTYIPTTYTTHNHPVIHNSFGTITTGGHFAATGTLTTSSTGIGYSSSSLSLL